MSDLFLRYYQEDALKALYEFLRIKKGNPLVVLPTASGKSLIIAKFIADNAEKKILALTHRKELIEQNHSELKKLAPKINVDVYAASLGQKELKANVIMASIQSYYNVAVKDLELYDYVLIDECHLVSNQENTQYSKVLTRLKERNPKLQIIGFSATPYRLDSGVLTEGKNRIFHEIVYEISISELVERGYLCPLLTRVPAELDLSGLTVRNGDYNKTQLDTTLAEKHLVGNTIADLARRGKDRQSWIIFAAGKRHLNMVAQELELQGVSHVIVHSGMSIEQRDYNIALFKNCQVQAMVNIDILTTGFNATNIDLIALLRPTKSTGLYVQMIGRGFRKDVRKKDCLVLDYANNIAEHGPVDAIKTVKTNAGLFLMKDANFRKACQSCYAPMRVDWTYCRECGCEYVGQHRPIHHEMNPTELSVLAGNPVWVQVTGVQYVIKQSCGGKPLDHVKFKAVYSLHNLSNPVEIDFCPYGNVHDNEQPESEITIESKARFKEWFNEHVVHEQDKVTLADLETSGNYYGDRNKVDRLLDGMRDKKYFKEPLSALVIKTRQKELKVIILGYNFDEILGQEEMEIEEEKEDEIVKLGYLNQWPRNIINRVIDLYNLGNLIRDIPKILAEEGYEAGVVQLTSIITKRYVTEYSDKIVPKEEWYKINFNYKLHKGYEVNQETGCWIWKGDNCYDGPRVYFKKKAIQVRTFLYEEKNKVCLTHEQLPEITCGNKKCVNPEHLKLRIKKMYIRDEREHVLKNNPNEWVELYNKGWRIVDIIQELCGKELDPDHMSTYASYIANVAKGKIRNLSEHEIISKKEWSVKNAHLQISQAFNINEAGCWIWKEISASPERLINIKRRSYELVHGEGTTRRKQRFSSSCEDKYCINPQHLSLVPGKVSDEIVTKVKVINIKTQEEKILPSVLKAAEFLEVSQSTFRRAIKPLKENKNKELIVKDWKIELA